MEIKIGKYTLYKRTEYSRFRLIVNDTEKDITKESPELLEQLLKEYNRQTKPPYKYFEIDGNVLARLKSAAYDKPDISIPDVIENIGDHSFERRGCVGVYIPTRFL